jgi:hypothetical protein
VRLLLAHLQQMAANEDGAGRPPSAGEQAGLRLAQVSDELAPAPGGEADAGAGPSNEDLHATEVDDHADDREEGGAPPRGWGQQGASEGEGSCRMRAVGGARDAEELARAWNPPITSSDGDGGTAPAWVTLHERSFIREDWQEEEREHQRVLTRSVWARDLPVGRAEREQSFVESAHRSLSLSGQSFMPEPKSFPDRGPGARGVSRQGEGGRSWTLGDHRSTMLAVGQPLLMAGTNPSMDRPGEGASAAAAVHDAPQPFSPVPGGRPATAPAAPPPWEGAATGGALTAAAAAAATAAPAAHILSSTPRPRRPATAGGGGLSTAVTASLMLRETVAPDPTGRDPMRALKLWPAATTHAVADRGGGGEGQPAAAAAASQVDTAPPRAAATPWSDVIESLCMQLPRHGDSMIHLHWRSAWGRGAPNCARRCDMM